MNISKLIEEHHLLVRLTVFNENWKAGVFAGITGCEKFYPCCREGTEFEAETLEEAVRGCITLITKNK